MKQFKFLAAIGFAAAMSFSISSCNNGEEKKADDKAADSAAVTAPVKPANLLLVTHKVANYAKWLVAYEANDSLRVANGLHSYVIARGLNDSNTVMVANKMDDAAKAKEFAASPALKDAMQKAGVISAPTISYLDVQMQDTATNTANIRLMVTHKVKDWDAWKKSFDSHKQTRVDAGLTDRVIAYSVGDNHMVTLVFIVSDMKKAEAFSKSDDLKKKMEEAGVDGPPAFFYYTVAKKY